MEAQRIITIIALLISNSAYSQSIEEQRTGFLRSQANIAGGYLHSLGDFRPYLSGDFDLFVDEQVSVTGEGWLGFKTDNSFQTGLVRNHSIFGGLNYHPVKKGKWDPYLGLSPGLAVVEAYSPCEGICTLEAPSISKGVAPLVSGVVGCNYYIGSIFHLFVKARGVAGRFKGESGRITQLHETKISAGLGWNLRIWKRKS